MSESLKFKGTVHFIGEVNVISDKFQTLTFVLENVTNNRGVDYSNYTAFQLMNQSIDKLSPFLKEGEDVEVSFNAVSRKHESQSGTRWFTNLNAWRIDPIASTAPAQPKPVHQAAAQAAVPVTPAQQPSPEMFEDDLPF